MSNKPTPTPEQQRVIDQRDSNLLVSASAGTGKTTVMIERLTKLIAEGANVQDFVVVTYTKLAASEMKKKLADSLSKVENTDAAWEHLMDGVTPAAVRPEVIMEKIEDEKGIRSAELTLKL